MLNEIPTKSLWPLTKSTFKVKGACESLIPKALTKKGLPVRIRAILSDAGWLQRSCFLSGRLKIIYHSLGAMSNMQ